MKLLVLSCVFFAHFAASSKVSESGVPNYDLDSWDTDSGKFDSEIPVGFKELQVGTGGCCRCCSDGTSPGASGSCDDCGEGGVHSKIAFSPDTGVSSADQCDGAFTSDAVLEHDSYTLTPEACPKTKATAKCCKCCDGTILWSASGSCSTCKEKIRETFSYGLAVSAPTSEARATACEEAFATPPTAHSSYTDTGKCPVVPGEPQEGACPVRKDSAKAGDKLPAEVIYVRHGHKDGGSPGKLDSEKKIGKNWRKPLTESGQDNDPKVMMQFLYKYITSTTEKTNWNDVVIYSSPWRRTISTSACLMQKLAESKDKLKSGKSLKNIKLKLEKGFPEKDHKDEIPYLAKYPCRYGCKGTLDASGEEGPTCDEPIVKIVKDKCGVTWNDDFSNGLSWFDQTYKNKDTDGLYKGPGSGIKLSKRIERAWQTTINTKKYRPNTLVIIFGHGTFGQTLFDEHVEQKSWRNTNWWPGTMNFLRWNDDQSKLRSVGEKYPFQDSFDLGRLERCAVETPVEIKYYRRKQKTGTLVNWKGENGVPKALTVKLNKKNKKNCEIDYFNCKPSGKSAYECTMAGYRGEYGDCANWRFANTFKSFWWPGAPWIKWNSMSGADALAGGLTHVTISGIGPAIAALPSCADETTQSLVGGESKVSINAEPGTGSLPQSLDDSEAKVSISEPVSEGLFLANNRPFLLLTAIAITVFWISLRHYRKKAAVSTEATTYLLEDEL